MEDFVNLVSEIINDVKDPRVKALLQGKIDDYSTVFSLVRWKRLDIEEEIRTQKDIENPTEEDIDAVLELIDVDSIEDRMIEEGWFFIQEAVADWEKEDE